MQSATRAVFQDSFLVWADDTFQCKIYQMKKIQKRKFPGSFLEISQKFLEALSKSQMRSATRAVFQDSFVVWAHFNAKYIK